MQPPTDRRREAPGVASRAGERTRQQPPPAGPGRLFFMPAPEPAPPGRHHRPPPPAVDRDSPFFMPPPAPPGRSRSNQPPPADPPSASSTRPAPPPPPAPSPPPPPPAHSYGDYDPTTGSPSDSVLRRPPHQTPLPPPHRLPRPSSPCSSALSSCLVATAFLLLSAGGAGAALFLLFRPRPPDISVAAVRLPSFSASNGTVAFTFEQTAAVRNPNRSPLAHFDSSLRVAYAGGELGAAVYIPAGLIGGGSTKHVSAVFDVPAIPVAGAQTTMVAAAGADAASAAQQQQSQAPAVIEVHSLLVVKGRVNVLRVFTHRVQAAKLCRVGVSPLDGTVLGFRC